MKALHFGAGNIGRGFIGEVYHDNHIETIYVDVNENVIDALNKEHQIKVIFANNTLQDKILDDVSVLVGSTAKIIQRKLMKHF